MNLIVEIEQDFDGTISVKDYTRNSDEYISEENDFNIVNTNSVKYSLSKTIDILKYQSVKGEELIDVIYTDHDLDLETESVRFPVTKDGYFTLDHIVLPTKLWLDLVKDEDLSMFSVVYIADGCLIYQWVNGSLISVDINVLSECNPDVTTMSIAKFDLFNISGIRNCYISLSKKSLENCKSASCNSVDETLKFNRDFIWMLYNTLIFYIEDRMYRHALALLEKTQGCYDFCGNIHLSRKINSCGCHKQKTK